METLRHIAFTRLGGRVRTCFRKESWRPCCSRLRLVQKRLSELTRLNLSDTESIHGSCETQYLKGILKFWTS